MKFILNVIYGCIIGVANIIPGVSGGTMAVILNIYDKLIESVTGIRKHFKESILFLLPVLIGGAAGIVGFSKLLKYLLAVCPAPTFFFFGGLIIGSLPMIFRKALETKFRPISVIPFVIFGGIMIILAFINTTGSERSSFILEMNVANWLFLFFGSVLAAMCMIIPGVSGSMILMILGLYSTVLGAIADLTHDFVGSCMILLPVGLGVLTGILGGAKLIDLCLKRFPQMTFFAIMGLMVGSLLSIYNNSSFAFDSQGIIAFVTLLLSFGVAFLFGSEKLKAKLETKKSSGKTDTPDTP